MKNKITPHGKTLQQGHFTERIYDYLDTGSLDPTIVKIPYRVFILDNSYRWEAQTPLGSCKSPAHKSYEACLEDFEDFKAKASTYF